MIKLSLISIIALLGTYPLAKIRKNIITENELYGIFLGNYIYYAHYFLIICVILFIINTFIIKLSTKIIAIIIAVSLLFAGAVGYFNYRNTQVTYTKINLEKKANISSIKIAFVADFHLTTTSNKNLFIDMVNKINEQKPDIIFIGGDILQNSHTKLKDDYASIFTKLKAPYGVYAILGNHEYYGNDVEENIKYLNSLGMIVLRDKVVNIHGISFIGRDDIRRDYTKGQRKTLKELYDNNKLSPKQPIIVLDHNPKDFSESIATKADVQLSAHTHAGQFFPYNLILKLNLPNAYGYKKIDNLHTIVTSGVGVGFWKIVGPWQMPYRFGTRSEINIIEVDFI